MAKRYKDGAYAGEGARRTQEMQDSGMIREDRSAVANMPQNVMYKDWPTAGYNMPEDIDDTIRGVDRQMSELDGGKVRSGMKPKKV